MFARDARNWSPSRAGNPILHFTRGHYASLFVRVQEDAGAGEGGELRRDGAGPPAQDALGSLRVSGLLEMGKGGSHFALEPTTGPEITTSHGLRETG